MPPNLVYRKYRVDHMRIFFIMICKNKIINYAQSILDKETKMRSNLIQKK